jgi:hypothetical protein
MFIWTKRQLVAEMTRLTGDGPRRAVVITHAHNDLVSSPSHGQALPPQGYRDLFEVLEPRLYAEGALLDDIVAGRVPDLSRWDGARVLESDPALTIIAASNGEVFETPLPRGERRASCGVLMINPLYERQPDGDKERLRLRFPSSDYEEEFGECRRYLPEEVINHRGLGCGPKVRGSTGPAREAGRLGRS